jgi:hypothetical protein
MSYDTVSVVVGDFVPEYDIDVPTMSEVSLSVTVSILTFCVVI